MASTRGITDRRRQPRLSSHRPREGSAPPCDISQSFDAIDRRGLWLEGSVCGRPAVGFGPLAATKWALCRPEPGEDKGQRTTVTHCWMEMRRLTHKPSYDRASAMYAKLHKSRIHHRDTTRNTSDHGGDLNRQLDYLNVKSIQTKSLHYNWAQDPNSACL